MSEKRAQLDAEELQILQDFERGEFESIRSLKAEKRALEGAAGNTLQKDKRINIRISSRDPPLPGRFRFCTRRQRRSSDEDGV